MGAAAPVRQQRRRRSRWMRVGARQPWPGLAELTAHAPDWNPPFCRRRVARRRRRCRRRPTRSRGRRSGTPSTMGRRRSATSTRACRSPPCLPRRAAPRGGAGGGC
jgi:hypothetical protein